MMQNDYAQARKQYVEEVRRSFRHAQEDDYEEDEPVSVSVSFLKVRLLISVCIFAAFILCDRTGSQFYHYTTEEVISMLQEERFQPQLDSIREAWTSITQKPQDKR